MNDPIELIKWIRQLWDAGSVVAVSVLLFGNYTGIWMWRKDHVERITQLTAQHATRIEELNELLEERKAAEKRWQDMALGLLTPLEATADRLTTLTRGNRR